MSVCVSFEQRRGTQLRLRRGCGRGSRERQGSEAASCRCGGLLAPWRHAALHHRSGALVASKLSGQCRCLDSDDSDTADYKMMAAGVDVTEDLEQESSDDADLALVRVPVCLPMQTQMRAPHATLACLDGAEVMSIDDDEVERDESISETVP